MNKFLFLTQPAITFAHEHIQKPDIDEQENVFIDESKMIYSNDSDVDLNGQNTAYHMQNRLNHE